MTVNDELEDVDVSGRDLSLLRCYPIIFIEALRTTLKYLTG
jgi:hypothetical protein